MKLFNYFLILFLLVSFQAHAKTDIEFLLDFSGSMRKASGGESQIDSARKALLGTLQTIPEDSFVAVRVYGHRIEQNKKKESCRDTELIVPLSAIDKEQIQSKIQLLTPKGYTPIAFSLEQTKNDFSAEREADKVIILLSDGEETCDGDPVAALKKLKEDGFQVIVHTIGFNVDPKTRQQLEAIAQAGGGHYYDAQGAAALNEALKEATKESLVIDKEKTTYGHEIRGGDSYETAVPLKFEIEYRLDHHQKISFFDYFFVDLPAGKELTIELHTLEKGINLRGEKPQETSRPYAGIQLHGSSRNKIKNINIIGDPHSVSKYSYNVTEAGRYYILVGSTYDDINKDHVTFKITSLTRGDLDSDKDAGASLTKAMPMEAKRYTKNYIGSGDLIDVFSFKAKKNEPYFVGIIPNEDSGSYFRIAIFDSYKQKIMSQNSGVNEGIKTKNFTIPEDGTYYLQIDLGVKVNKPASYTLELKNVGWKPKKKAPKKSKPAAKKKSSGKSTPKKTTLPELFPDPESKPFKPQPIEGPGPLSRPSKTAPPPQLPPPPSP